MKKKSPNKWTKWRIGIPCQNCNKADWRISEKFSDDEFAVFYCIHCGAFRGKINDLPMGIVRENFLKEYKEYEKKIQSEIQTDKNSSEEGLESDGINQAN